MSARAYPLPRPESGDDPRMLQRHVLRAEATAQRGEWHVDISDEALAVLASNAGSGVAR